MNSPLLSQTLQKTLREWTDVDFASYYVAIALGVAPDPGEECGWWGGKKWVFWSANPLGDECYRILESLASIGVLERRDEPDLQYRWNAQFNWTSYQAPPGSNPHEQPQ